MEGYKISTSVEDMDFDLIHGYLSKSYWAEGIPKQTLNKAISNSLCFGVFNSLGEQVGFGRMITDKATFAYMADVFILEEHQGKGLGKWMINEIMAHPDLKGLRRINLATRDAHSLYEQFGFQALSNPDTVMEMIDPDIYK